MEVTRTVKGDLVELAVDGRLDGYWADHLDSAIGDAVRGGYRRVRLDLAKVTFLSSAGIAVMMKYYKQLTRIDGSLRVLNPAPTVQTVLDITRLSSLLIKEPGDLTIRPTRAGRFLERAGATFQVVDLDSTATLTCRAVGSDEPLATGAFREDHCRSLGSLAPLFAVGVGAFGDELRGLPGALRGDGVGGGGDRLPARRRHQRARLPGRVGAALGRGARALRPGVLDGRGARPGPFRGEIRGSRSIARSP